MRTFISLVIALIGGAALAQSPAPVGDAELKQALAACVQYGQAAQPAPQPGQHNLPIKLGQLKFNSDWSHCEKLRQEMIRRQNADVIEQLRQHSMATAGKIQ